MKELNVVNEYECAYCGEVHPKYKLHLSVDYGNETEYVDRDCMFEYIFDNFVVNGSATDFIVAMTDGFGEYMKRKVK